MRPSWASTENPARWYFFVNGYINRNINKVLFKMSETSISFHSQDDRVTIHTTSKAKAKTIKKRLEKREADWEWAKYQNGEGSYKFEVLKDDVRHPKLIIKGKRRNVDPTWLYEDDEEDSGDNEKEDE